MTDTGHTIDYQQWVGRNALDRDGTKIGKIGQVYLDDQSGDPAWVTVSTGLFGTRESFAPLFGSHPAGDDLQLAMDKQLVRDAPHVAFDQHLSEAETDALYDHYNSYLAATNQHTADTTDTDRFPRDTPGAHTGEPDIQSRDTSRPTTEDAMTRSEERLHVGTETVQTGRARLRKYVVEEHVSQTVTLSHEEVYVQREPITDANLADALAGAELSETEHVITLHAERPIVVKETVPMERVTLGTETVTEQAQINDTVRKERIDEVEHTPTEDDPTTRPSPDH